MSARHPLSTNSELAKLLEDHVAKIRESIPGERVLISDQTTLALILRAAVQNLSPKLREVVIMKFWGGLTFLQI